LSQPAVSAQPTDTWFQQQLLAWFDLHGRKDLPWQLNPTPYRVWVSEIMLQQTQVATVIDYYQRFMARFPDISSLASAHIDDVLHLWSGLGYYARGRNLHRSARLIHDQYGDEFPDNIETLIQLPGIGRSTAGAILALAFGQHHAILDGNVKRVLCRFEIIEGWPGTQSVQKRLWELAERYTPAHRVGDYTQAIMDLGATLCSRTRPACEQCPVSAHCQALAQQKVNAYPQSKPRKTIPVRQTRLLILQNEAGHILLQQRPPAGIWGGLWSLPECPDDITDIPRWIKQQFKGTITKTGESMRHTFSHFHLDITPIVALSGPDGRIMDDQHQLWYNPAKPKSLGLAAPIKKLLARYSRDTTITEGTIK